LTPRLAKTNVFGGTLLATVAIGKKIIVRDIAICWRQKNETLEDWIATMATGRKMSVCRFATTDEESVRIAVSG
jgi:hypothetical protein